MRLALACASLVLLSACSVELAEGHYTCTMNADCPSGWSCNAGLCYSRAFDAGPVDTGVIDSGPVDANREDMFVELDGAVDAGPQDAGVDVDLGADAGPPDAGPPDAGPPDAGPPHVIGVATGAEHTCAIDTAGNTYCWGENAQGQLGVGGTPALATSAVVVPGAPAGALQIEASYQATCARTATEVHCWGANNWFGNHSVIGRAALGLALLPVPVDLGAATADQIALGVAHACARLSTGELMCWGLNSAGQLGLGDTTDTHPTPTTLSGIADVIDVCAGALFTCAVTSSGAVLCWGDDAQGQLGRGTTSTVAQTVPAPTLILSGATDVECGYRHACAVHALSAGGTELLCWGSNVQGEVGVTGSPNEPTPRQVPTITSPAVLALGGRDPVFSAVQGVSCASLGMGLSCWGSNHAGQLGRGAALPVQTATPGSVSSLSGLLLDADVGYAHACAVEELSGGSRVRCWGLGTHGELGDRMRTNSDAPVTVRDLL